MHPRDFDPYKIKLDFSQFHDLMHRPFTAECRSMYGGWRHHVSLWWEYMGRPRLAYLLKCRFGWHYWLDGWSKALGDCQICRNCHDMREP